METKQQQPGTKTVHHHFPPEGLFRGGKTAWKVKVAVSLLVAALIFAAILPGPGFRFLVKAVILNVAEKKGLKGDFVVDGNLFTGVSLKNINLTGGDSGIAKLNAEEARVEYRFGNLVTGFPEFDWLDVASMRGLNVHVRIPDRKEPDSKKTAKPGDEIASTRQEAKWWNLFSADLSLANATILVEKKGRTYGLQNVSLSLSPDGENKFESGAWSISGKEVWKGGVFPIERGSESFAIKTIPVSNAIGISDFSFDSKEWKTDLLADGAVINVRFRFDGAASISLAEGDSVSLDKTFGPQTGGDLKELKLNFTGEFRRPESWELFGVVDLHNLSVGSKQVGDVELRITGEDAGLSIDSPMGKAVVDLRWPFKDAVDTYYLRSIPVTLNAQLNEFLLPEPFSGLLEGGITDLEVLNGKYLQSGAFWFQSKNAVLYDRPLNNLKLSGKVERPNLITYEADLGIDSENLVDAEGTLNNGTFTYTSNGVLKLKDEVIKGGGSLTWQGAGNLAKKQHSADIALDLSNGDIAIKGDLALDGDSLKIPGIAVSESSEQRMYVHGKLPLRWKEEDAGIDLQINCNQLDLSSLTDFYTMELPVEGVLSGFISSTGTFQELDTAADLTFVPDYKAAGKDSMLSLRAKHKGNPVNPSTWELDMDGLLTGLQWKETPLENLALKVETFVDSVQKVAFANLSLNQSTAKVEARSSIGLTNAIDFASLLKEPISIDGKISVERLEKVLDDFSIDPGVPVAGGIDVTIGDIRYEQGHWNQGELQIRSDTLRIADRDPGKVRLEAQVVSPDNIEATVSLPLDGISKLEGKGKFDSKTRSYAGELQAVADFESPGVVQAVFADRRISQLLPGFAKVEWEGRGSIPDKVHRGNIAASGRNISLAEGAESFDMTLNGKYTESSVQIPDLEVTSRPLNISGEGAWEKGVLQLKDFSGKSGDKEVLHISGKVPLDPKAGSWFANRDDIALALTTTNLKIEELAGFVNPAAKLQGTLKSDFSISGQPLEPDLEGKLKLSGISVEKDEKQLPVGELSLNLKTGGRKAKIDGEFRHPDVNPLRIKAETGFFPAKWAGDKTLLQKTGIAASAKMERSSLAFLSSQIPGVQSIDGTVALDVSVSGTVGEPKILGNGEILAKSLRFQDRNAPKIYEMDSKLRFEDNNVHLDRLRAIVAGGEVNVSGIARLDGREPDLQFSVAGSDILVARTPELNVRTDADLNISGPWSKARISGDLGITKSRFHKNVDLVPGKFPIGGRSAVPSVERTRPAARDIDVGVDVEPFQNWPLAVHVHTKDPFLIRGNVAETELNADMVITGTLGEPIPNGLVKLKEGDLRLPFSKLDVETGKVLFSGKTGFNGALEFKARAESGGNKINIYAYNRILQPKHVLTSVPPMSQENIISTLLTGYSTEDFLDGDAGSVAASKAASLVLNRLKQSSERAGVEPGIMQQLEERTELEVGKIDPKTGAHTFAGRVRLWKQLFLAGDVDSQSDYRALLKYVFQYE